MDMQKKKRAIGLTASIFFVITVIGLVIMSNTPLDTVHAGLGPGGNNRNTKSYPVVNLRPIENRYSWGGVMNFPNTQNIAVYLESYNISGDADITIYKASEQNLLNYLIHDDKNNQKDTNFSTADFPVVARLAQNVRSGYENRVLVSLPITEETGIWYFTVSLDSTTNHGFIVKSSFGLSAVESKGSYIFWAQDFKSHESIRDVEVSTYSLLGSRTELGGGKTNDEGILETPFSALADIALAKRGNDYALLPLNLTYLNTNYAYTRFDGKYARGKYFVFTDRPIYKPGDTVYYKVIVRDTEGAGYLVPNTPITVRLGDVEKPLFEKTLPLSALGTADGEYTLPENIQTGYHNLIVSLPPSASRLSYDEQSIYFQVENYRKPEYFLDVTSPAKDAKVGETIAVALNGTFFSGNPASGLDVTYTVTMSDWSDYEWGASSNESANYYGSYYGEEVQKSTVQLDRAGFYQLNINTNTFASKIRKNKIISVNATLLDSSGNPSTRTKNFLLYSADYTAYASSDSTYSTRAGGDGNMTYTIKPNRLDTKAQSLKANYSVERINWEKSGVQDQYGYDSYVEKKYSIVKNVQTTVDPEEFEKYVVSFPTSKAGSYHVTISFTDKSGGVYSREDWIWVYAPNEAWYGYDGEAIHVTSAKKVYAPDDTISISVNVPYQTGKTLVALGKNNVLSYDVLTVSNGIATYSTPVRDEYLPQVVVLAYGFSGKRLLSGNATLNFDTTSKKIVVGIQPEKNTYGPGETATVEVSTKDANGSGVPAEVTVWAMDKALTELVSGNTDTIFNTFWGVSQTNFYYWNNLWIKSASSLENINYYDEGGGGGGCFGAETNITMSDGSLKPIHKVSVGDTIRTLTNGKTGANVIAKVTSVHKTDTDGYLLINGSLQITPNHILSINNRWRMAGEIQVGDTLIRENGNTESVRTIQYINEQIPVYNLTIEGYHTFIADGIWVHNQKGGDTRAVFKDTAYWNPNLQTNSQGVATIYVKLPDNLTTWVLQGVAVGENTKVGSIAKEIVVTKNVIVRPIVANQYRVGDAFRLETNIENYTDLKQTFEYSLKAPDLTISNPTRTVTIEAGGKALVAWEVRAKTPNKNAQFTFTAQSQTTPSDSDSVRITVPVTNVYLEDDVSAFATGDHTFPVDIPRGVDMAQSTLKLSLASSISHTLPSSLEYLISYPYGCTEQTTTRLLALLMAKENPELFKQVTKDKDVEDMIEKGMKHLVALQRSDGGWGYWESGDSEPFTSVYVTILLKRLMLAGYTVSEYTYNSAKTYITNNLRRIDMKSPDTLSLMLVYRMVVLEESPNASAIESLKKQALILGESAHWSAGLWKRYGSVDSSTGLALQALSIAGDTDLDLRTKAVRYLMANRKHAYWSHTFGTLQSAYGILLSEKENPEGVTLPYSVKIGNEEVVSGTLKIPEDKDIKLPLEPNIFTSSMSVNVQYSGPIQGYATLTAHWVHTTPSIQARKNGLTITHRYQNATDKLQSIGVGDLVNVVIDVRGDTAFDTQYIVVEDQLPSGMIPVNTRLKNEYENRANGPQFRFGDSYEYGIAGVVIGSSDWYGERPKDTFTYQARVVSSGSFHAPPVRAQLMYLPEVSGHSSSDSIVIQQKGTLPFPVVVWRTGTNVVKGIVDWMYTLYVRATSPIDAFFTREYINAFTMFILIAVGAGIVVKVVSNRVQILKKKHVNKQTDASMGSVKE